MSMDKDKRVAFELDDLPMDVFELAERGLTVESLTAGHGMTEGAGASQSQRTSSACLLCCEPSRHSDLRGDTAPVDCDR